MGGKLEDGGENGQGGGEDEENLAAERSGKGWSGAERSCSEDDVMFGPWSEVIGEAGWLVGRKIQQVALWTGPGWVGAVIEALDMRID